MAKKEKIHWLAEPEPHNYPSAQAYLTLVFEDEKAKLLARELETAPMTAFKAKDIFRASQLSLLGVSNSHVQKNQEKIEDEKALSPILLVRTGNGGRVIVADGYHRMCSVYHYDEDALIPCKIITA
ncbi:MAG: hypothetical protein H6686_09970 [Fibrobacteria bacterium]|nr:hypothetical protein [Fibrobacteria bacterium]